MILTDIDTYHQLGASHEAVVALLDYVRAHDLLHAEPGCIAIDGKNAFINNVQAQCAGKQERLIELHREYIDVHVLLEGEETIGWKYAPEICSYTQPYSEASDCALSAERPTKYFTLHPGDVAIAFPDDGHAPAIGSGTIRKLIGKIKI